MLKRLVNEALFTLTLTTTGPVLIRSGQATLSGPDMTPILTNRNGERQVYFPGSSLKGVFRSHLEKIGRTINEPIICNPFNIAGGQDLFCGQKLLNVKEKDYKNKKLPTDLAYHQSCPICRLFGSTAYTGRISIGDAYLDDDQNPRPTELRDGVGIDRFTGGAANGAKFDLETVSAGVAFSSEVYVRNFEIWQLGMLFVLIQDLADGLIRLGSGTSRGFGSVEGQVKEVTLNHIGALNQAWQIEIWGLGKFLVNSAGSGDYGTSSEDILSVDQMPKLEANGIRQKRVFSEKALTNLSQQASDHFIKYLQGLSA